MIRGFYSAGSGLASQQTAIDNAANNIANVSTTGFKKRDLNFSELLYSKVGTEASSSQNLNVGNGTRVATILNNFSQGSIEASGNELDFALKSDGFFAVQSQDGSTKYTRDGNFKISSESEGDYLVNSSGEYVLDKDSNKLIADEPGIKDKIGVFDFSNPYGLNKAGNNLFTVTAQSGQPITTEGKLISGGIELSNVDLATEMTDLLSIQRAYQFNAKFIQTADEIENITNNLK